MPTASVPAAEAEGHFGPFAAIMALDFPPMTSPETRAMLGWEPTHPGLISDLAEGHCLDQA